MIKTEIVDNRIRHYSDCSKKIQQVETGIVYEEAIDVLPCRYTYAETDVAIDDELSAEEALAIISGGADDEAQ